MKRPQFTSDEYAEIVKAVTAIPGVKVYCLDEAFWGDVGARFYDIIVENIDKESLGTLLSKLKASARIKQTDDKYYEKVQVVDVYNKIRIEKTQKFVVTLSPVDSGSGMERGVR